MSGTLPAWTDGDDYVVSVDRDPDAGEILIWGERMDYKRLDCVSIPVAALPWFLGVLNRMEREARG